MRVVAGEGVGDRAAGVGEMGDIGEEDIRPGLQVVGGLHDELGAIRGAVDIAAIGPSHGIVDDARIVELSQ